MLIKEAIEKRIFELCHERNIAINTLANISGVSPSTVYSILNEKSQNPGIVSIKKIADGQRSLLRSEMLQIYYRNRETGIIHQYEYENFVYLYEAV